VRKAACRLSKAGVASQDEGWELESCALLEESVTEMIGSSKCRQSSPAAVWLAMPVTLRIQEQERYDLNRCMY